VKIGDGADFEEEGRGEEKVNWKELASLSSREFHLVACSSKKTFCLDLGEEPPVPGEGAGVDGLGEAVRLGGFTKGVLIRQVGTLVGR
jgi:hypothetical protein